MIRVEFSFSQKSISDLGLSKILLGVLDFIVLLFQELIKGFLNVHNLNIF